MEMISYNFYHQLLMSGKIMDDDLHILSPTFGEWKISGDYFQFLSQTFGEWKILK